MNAKKNVNGDCIECPRPHKACFKSGLDACGQRSEAIQQTANPPEISPIS